MADYHTACVTGNVVALPIVVADIRYTSTIEVALQHTYRAVSSGQHVPLSNAP